MALLHLTFSLPCPLPTVTDQNNVIISCSSSSGGGGEKSTRRRRRDQIQIEKKGMESSTETNPNKKKVIVCGGGVIGVCTAYFLAEKGGSSVSVTLLEKSSVACAASGKAGGFLALDWCDGGPLSSLARASFRLHHSLSAALSGPSSYSFRHLHTLSLSLDPSTTTPPPHSPSMPDWIDGPARSLRTIGTVETTAQVHPKQFTRSLLSAAVEKHGVEVVIGEAKRVEFDDGGVVIGVFAKIGAKGRTVVMPADDVVLALGPWSARLSIVSSLFQVSGLKAHSIVLRPRDAEAITPHALFLRYYPSPRAQPLDPEVYPRPNGEVYICGMSEDVEVPDDPEQIVGKEESIRMLHKVAETVSSKLGRDQGATVEKEQACFLPCTEDGLPVIGQMPNSKGCYVATGHSCWGILNGPATGAAMAELVLDGHASIVDLTPFNPARFLHRCRNRIGSKFSIGVYGIF